MQIHLSGLKMCSRGAKRKQHPSLIAAGCCLFHVEDVMQEKCEKYELTFHSLTPLYLKKEQSDQAQLCSDVHMIQIHNEKLTENSQIHTRVNQQIQMCESI